MTPDEIQDTIDRTLAKKIVQVSALNKIANPPAFACPDTEYGNGNEGMSLRDWFAGQALQGLIAGIANEEVSSFEYGNFATDAYGFADAMLQARQQV